MKFIEKFKAYYLKKWQDSLSDPNMSEDDLFDARQQIEYVNEIATISDVREYIILIEEDDALDKLLEILSE